MIASRTLTLNLWCVIPWRPHNMLPSCMSCIINRMHVLTSTIIWPVGPMGRVIFFKQSLAVLNVCKTTWSWALYFQRLLPCGWIWFCANNAHDLGRKPWYPQASIFWPNFSVNIAGVNTFGLSENLSFPVTDVRTIHWIMGTNSSRSRCLTCFE